MMRLSIVRVPWLFIHHHHFLLLLYVVFIFFLCAASVEMGPSMGITSMTYHRFKPVPPVPTLQERGVSYLCANCWNASMVYHLVLLFPLLSCMNFPSEVVLWYTIWVSFFCSLCALFSPDWLLLTPGSAILYQLWHLHGEILLWDLQVLWWWC